MSNSTSTPVQVVLVKGRYHRDTCKRVQAEQFSPYAINETVVTNDTPAATCCKPNNSPEWKAVAAAVAAGEQAEPEATTPEPEAEAEVSEEQVAAAKAAHPSNGKKADKPAAKKAEPAPAAGPKRRVGHVDAEGTDVAYRGVGWVRYWPTVGNIGGQVLVQALGDVEVTFADNVHLGLRLKGGKRAVKRAAGLLTDMWAAARPAVKAWAEGEGKEQVAAAADGRALFVLDKEFLTGFYNGFAAATLGSEETMEGTTPAAAGFRAGRAAAAGEDLL